MVRSLAVLLLLCLSAQSVFAFTVNWSERVQRFSRYVDRHAIAQDRRTQVLGTQSRSFNSRVQSYVKNLHGHALSAKNP